jgi:hypothetical protein
LQVALFFISDRNPAAPPALRPDEGDTWRFE